MITEFNSREAVPVEIAGFTLYCEKFTASASRSVSEKPTVSGENTVTESFPHAARLTFTGRIYSETDPLSFVMRINNCLHSDAVYSVVYRGLGFINCTIQEYSAEDCGEDFIMASVTVITPETFIPVPENMGGASIDG